MGVDENKYMNTVMGRNLLTTNKSYALTNNGLISNKGLTKEEEEEIKKGFEISDKIIKSNYFKK